jgi:hypothetical protein
VQLLKTEACLSGINYFDMTLSGLESDLMKALKCSSFKTKAFALLVAILYPGSV